MTEPRTLDLTAALSAVIPADILAKAAELGPLPVQREETPEQRAERLQAAAALRAAAFQAPAMYAAARFADLDPATQHQAAVSAWLDSDSPTLVLAGRVGGGKTHAAYAVGNDAVRRGIWTESWTVTQLFADMRPDGDRTARDRARKAGVAILDDLGAAKVSDWMIQELTDLLDARLRSGKRTVVTTNKTSVELRAEWGERFVDRLQYRATACNFLGPSRRSAQW
jgi:DNA replication protein DnaC